MMGIKNVKKKVEKKKAEAEKPKDITKKEPKGEPVQPAKDEKKPEQKPEPDEKQEEVQEPAEDVGRVATPVENKAEESVEIDFSESAPEDRETVPEEERPTVSAPEPEVTQDTVVSSTPRTPEEIEQAIASAPDQKFSNEVGKAIGKGRYDEALQKALKIKDKELRNERIENVADEYAKKGDYRKARSIADNIDDTLVHARVVKEFATDFQMAAKDPKVILKAGKTLKDALRIAESAPANEARAAEIKDIEGAMNEFEEMKTKNRKVRDLVKKKKRNRVIAVLGSIAIAFLTEAYAKDIKEWAQNGFKAKQKTEQVSTDDEARKELELLKSQQGEFEIKLGVLGEDVDLIEPIGKSTGLYDGMPSTETGEIREELDYSKLKEGKARTFDEIDKDISDAVNETEMKEQLDEVDSIDFEGETEFTDLDKIAKKLELVNAKLEELAENGGQNDENLEVLKAVLEEKEQLLKLAGILANYKQGFHNDFCGAIVIETQETNCEEDQWVVLTDKNGISKRFMVYDEPTDCSDDCPTRTAKKKAPAPERGKGKMGPSI